MHLDGTRSSLWTKSPPPPYFGGSPIQEKEMKLIWMNFVRDLFWIGKKGITESLKIRSGPLVYYFEDIVLLVRCDCSPFIITIVFLVYYPIGDLLCNSFGWGCHPLIYIYMYNK